MNGRRLALAALAAALVAAFFLLDLGQYLSLDAVKARRDELAALYEAHAALMLGGYFCVYVLVTALSVPGAAVMTLAAGALFGFWTALVVVSFASSLGATLACLVARFLLRGWVRRTFADRLAAVNRGMERDGALYLFSMRLIPAIPFFAINLAMGLTPMRLSTFYWVSQLGMLPATAAYVFAGGELGRIRSAADVLDPRLAAAFVIIGLLPLAAKKFLAALRARAGAKPSDP